MDPAVAARVAASPSSISSRSFSSSSPATRLPPSGSALFSHSTSGLGGGEDAITRSTLTVEQVLAAHADSPRAALESILQERNSLNAQNSQLWNHLKKQRSIYQTAASDVKRYRAERDALRARLVKYEQGDTDRSDERRMRPSVSTRPPAANGPDEAKQDSPESMQGDMDSLGNANYRHPRNARHNSEDSPATSRRRSTSQDQHMQTPVSYSKMPAQSKPQERGRSNTNPEFPTSGPVNGSSNQSSPTSSYDLARPPFSSRPSKEHVVEKTTSPPPILPSSSEYPPADSSISSITVPVPQQVIVSLPSKNNEDPPDTARPLASRNVPSISTTDESSIFQVPPERDQGNSSLLSAANAGPASQPQNSLGLPNVRKASRESRITLPDEARQYYASLADSPMSSPRVNQEEWNQTQRVLNGDRTLSQVPEESETRGTDSASPRPFLELETTDDSDSERRRSDDNRVRETDSEVDSMAADHGYLSKRWDGTSHANLGRLPKLQIGDSVTTADQFPLPPSTLGGPGSGSPGTSSTLQGHNLYSGHPGAIASGSSLVGPSSSVVTSSTTLNPGATSSSRRSKEKVDSFIMPSNLPAATFRQMPLLDSDLKTASIDILGSHIRANDKGREVLSFVIAINVIGKEPWQIEKFYSDVLALDSRLRSRCNRSLLKKIEPLPDSKLFKDHAPAKVDQRKRMLQAYLQSVMHLPVKDKNEIIVFFSSDVVRERSPVTKTGYKEGYLTKRGKNFGGWKTRYFVLQGPVLEYYESRGGTHLGSIQITGAQIGRQQRNGVRDADDENEFRHAFLIIEQKRGPGSQNTRHVLCAESDRERDAWVEVLVRYVMGSYNDEEKGTPVSIVNPAASIFNGSAQPRASTSSLSINEVNPPRRTVSKDQIQKSAANPIPISQLPLEGFNVKFFSVVDPLSPVRSSADKGSISSVPSGDSLSKKSIEKSAAADNSLLPSSLPNASVLADASSSAVPVGPRANSEQGFYPDMLPPNGLYSSDQRPRERARASYHPSLGTVLSSPLERPPSPEKTSPAAASPVTARDDASRLGKISGPMNGVPIPAGYKFGSKDPPSEQPTNERERKSRSRAFWRWPTGEKNAAVPTFQARAVFGVPLEESVAVSQIANLPSIVFRCIQYLEAKKADQEEGIYRLSGSSAVIKSLKDRFNVEGDVDLLNSDVHDPHAVAGLLKSFLRELPSSLLTRDLHMQFLAVMDFVDTQERIKELQELISRLPLANYSLLRALTAHLILIVQNSNVNKMTMRNVGIVFSPTLGIPAGVFSLMLGEFNRVFNVNGDGSDSSVEDDEQTAPAARRPSPGLSRRNSKRYSDAAADQLLGLAGRALPVTEEDQSDEGDVISEPDDNEESDTEVTEETEEATVESSVDSVRPHSPLQVPQEQEQQTTNASLDPSGHKSRASIVAASRGLNIAVTTSKQDRRRSRLPIGLPVSPRPGYSPGSTPTSTYDPSPLQSQK